MNHEDQPSMDPNLLAEALFAVVGLGRVLAPGQVRATASQRRRAERLVEEMDARMARFIRGKRPSRKVEPRPFDWDEVATRVSRAMTPDILAEGLEVADGDLGLLFSKVVGRALKLAQDAMPKQAVDDIGIRRPRRPGDTSMARFLRTWGVVDDGTSIMRLLERGLLNTDEVRAFALVFPTLYRETRLSFFRAFAARLADNPAFRVMGTRALMVERLLQVRMTDVAALQAMYAQEKQEQEGARLPPARAAKDTLSTPVQKLADGAG